MSASSRWRCSAVIGRRAGPPPYRPSSLAIAVVVGAVILLLRPVLFAGLTLGDAAVLAMLAYLIA